MGAEAKKGFIRRGASKEEKQKAFIKAAREIHGGATIQARSSSPKLSPIVKIKNKWKHGDVRPDGRIFKQYQKRKRADGSEYFYEVWMKSGQWAAYRGAQKELSKQHYAKNRKSILERQKEYHRVHRAAILEKQKAYSATTKSAARIRSRKHYDENKPDILEKQKKWYQQNRHLVRETKRSYVRKRRSNDPQFALISQIRNRINSALRRKSASKKDQTKRLVGCDLKQLQAHIQAQFSKGMDWKNERATWHLDHIIPLAAFNLTVPEELRIACNYRNLRPLFKQANIRKGTSMPSIAEMKPMLKLLLQLPSNHPIRRYWRDHQKK